MAWLAKDKFGGEFVFESKPIRYPRIEKEDKRIKNRKQILGFEDQSLWTSEEEGYHEWAGFIRLPEGSIKKLIGKELAWENEPVEI